MKQKKIFLIKKMGRLIIMITLQTIKKRMKYFYNYMKMKKTPELLMQLVSTMMIIGFFGLITRKLLNIICTQLSEEFQKRNII